MYGGLKEQQTLILAINLLSGIWIGHHGGQFLRLWLITPSVNRPRYQKWKILRNWNSINSAIFYWLCSHRGPESREANIYLNCQWEDCQRIFKIFSFRLKYLIYQTLSEKKEQNLKFAQVVRVKYKGVKLVNAINYREILGMKDTKL